MLKPVSALTALFASWLLAALTFLLSLSILLLPAFPLFSLLPISLLSSSKLLSSISAPFALFASPVLGLSLSSISSSSSLLSLYIRN